MRQPGFYTPHPTFSHLNFPPAAHDRCSFTVGCYRGLYADFEKSFSGGKYRQGFAKILF